MYNDNLNSNNTQNSYGYNPVPQEPVNYGGYNNMTPEQNNFSYAPAPEQNNNFFNFDEDNSSNNVKNEQSSKLLERLAALEANPSFQKIMNKGGHIRNIVIYTILIIGLFTGWFAYIRPASNSLIRNIFTSVIVFVALPYIAEIVKSIIFLFWMPDMENKLSIYNEDYDSFMKQEVRARKMITVCDIISSFVPLMFGTLIGGFFIYGGIYFASHGQGMAFGVIFPLMGLMPIVGFLFPFIRNIRVFIELCKDPYGEKVEAIQNKPKLTGDAIAFLLGGVTFVVIGLFCIFGSIATFLPLGDWFQIIGMSIMGIICTAMGSAICVVGWKKRE